MFGLGVVVGRGSSPVLFETRPFQERLGRMVSELSANRPEKEKIDLKFYDVLDEPVPFPIKGKTEDPGEIIPGPEPGNTASIKPVPHKPQAEEIPVKHSKKLTTWHQAGKDAGNGDAPAPLLKKSASVKTVLKKSALVKTDTKASEKRVVTPPASKILEPKNQTGKKTDAESKGTGTYTIQIASYKDLNDALSRMVLLSSKGVTSYRVSVEINGVTWHRVRTGSFSDQEEARTRLAKLAGSGVNGMVIKKE